MNAQNSVWKNHTCYTQKCLRVVCEIMVRTKINWDKNFQTGWAHAMECTESKKMKNKQASFIHSSQYVQ